MIQVYLVKQKLKSKKENGRRNFRFYIRWQENGKWKSEPTGTADTVQAEGLRKVKWEELNGLRETPPEPEPESTVAPKPTWQECRERIEELMKGDNCRPKSIARVLEKFKILERMFPQILSPADVTDDIASKFKCQRMAAGLSAWTVDGDIAALKTAFGNRLKKLIPSNPFSDVTAPICDEPDIRIVTARESASLFQWLSERWNNWQLPMIYLQVASLLGWRATETASITEKDLLDDGFVRARAESTKGRKFKYGWLPQELYARLQMCCAGGFAFGKYSDELRRRLCVLKKRPNAAARVKDFDPKRLVGWMQDELKRFNEEQAKAAKEAGKEWEVFTLHDFRKTAITGMQMAGVSEKDASIMVGATPEVIRKHYEKMDGMAIAKRSVERRIAGGFETQNPTNFVYPLRADETNQNLEEQKSSQAVAS